MKAWEKRGDVWYLAADAQIEKINNRWYARVHPRRSYHLGPFKYLDRAMSAVSEFISERDHIPNCR